MTNLHNHDVLCDKNTTLWIDDETPSAEVVETVSGTLSWYTQAGHRRPNTFAVRSSLDSLLDHPISQEENSSLPKPYQRRKGAGFMARQKSSSLYLSTSLDDIDSIDKGPDKAKDKVLMTGWLYKTSRLKTSKARGNRQHRKFKLNAHSLEYSHFLQKVSVTAKNASS